MRSIGYANSEFSIGFVSTGSMPGLQSASPGLFTRTDGQPIALGGLWDRRTSADKSERRPGACHVQIPNATSRHPTTATANAAIIRPNPPTSLRGNQNGIRINPPRHAAATIPTIISAIPEKTVIVPPPIFRPERPKRRLLAQSRFRTWPSRPGSPDQEVADQYQLHRTIDNGVQSSNCVFREGSCSLR